MPSFDIVSQTDLAEVDNAINGSMREYLVCASFKLLWRFGDIFS